MERTYRYFDFQFFLEKIRDNTDDVINQLMLKMDKTEEEKQRLQDYLAFKKELRFITWDMKLEDLPLYQNFLKKFDVDSLLEDYNLVIIPNFNATDADYDVLLRFIFASQITKYNLVYDQETDEAVLYIIHQNLKKDKTLDDIWSLQFMRLLKIFLQEQLSMETARKTKKEWKDTITQQRYAKLMEFKEKMKQLSEQKLQPKSE